MENIIQQQLTQYDELNRYRFRIANHYGNTRQLVVDHNRYLNFSSNDYLGMSQDPAVIKAWQKGAELFGLGSGGSGHITGYSVQHQKLEEELANWLGYQRAILFTSGFAANQAAIYSLIDKDDAIIADKLSHASIQEAAYLQTQNYHRFQHNNMLSLQKIYHKLNCDNHSLLISEGVFSMDGDSAPLSELNLIATQNNSWLMIDDAHGIGVIGKQGRGSCYQQNIKPQILVITFGKAFGINGAAILCDGLFAELLIQKSRHLIYSTAMPIAQAYALQTALHQIQQADAKREQLTNNIRYFRQLAQSASLTLTPSQTAIQPYIVGDSTAALSIVKKVQERGIWLTAIRAPTVPANQARLRITLSSSHTFDDIEYLVEVLNACR